MKLEHIAVTITDSNELHAFYHNILGFKCNPISCIISGDSGRSVGS